MLLSCFVLIQFYVKLEEKMHAKEAETNRIQARAQARFPPLHMMRSIKHESFV